MTLDHLESFGTFWSALRDYWRLKWAGIECRFPMWNPGGCWRVWSTELIDDEVLR